MYNAWQYWTYYECGEPYYNVEALCDIDPPNGYAYGMYQFDYRYGLVPLMKLCYEHNPVYYKAFEQFIALGKKSKQLVNNKLLQSYFRIFATENTKDFLYCQDSAYVKSYLDGAMNNARKKNVPNLSNPYIVGTIGSMAIRDGASGSLTLKALSAMATSNDVKTQLKLGYDVFHNYFNPKGDGRWLRQYNKCISDLNNNLNVYDIALIPAESKNIIVNITEDGLITAKVE